MSAAAIGVSTTGVLGPNRERAASASPLSERRGCEQKELQDPAGRLISQLTDNRLESKHTYYDICPWNSGGKLVIFSSADLEDLKAGHGDTLSTQAGQVCVADTQTFEIQVIADAAFYTSHNGAFPLWHPIRNVAYYRRAPEEIGVVDLDSGKRSTMKGVLRQLSPDGTKFASQLNPADRPEQPPQLDT